MSNIVSAIARRRVVGSQTRKAILLLFAECASDDGSGIWMSKANMARDLEISESTVRRAIADLIAAGILVETGTRDCKHGHTIEYCISVEALKALPSTRDNPCHSDTRSSGTPVTVTPHPCHSDTPTPVTVTPKPSLEPSLNKDACGARKNISDGENLKRSAISAWVRGKRNGITQDWLTRARIEAMKRDGDLTEAEAKMATECAG